MNPVMKGFEKDYELYMEKQKKELEIKKERIIKLNQKLLEKEQRLEIELLNGLEKKEKLENFKQALVKYNNKKMPDELQKEISKHWNGWSLWKYVNYGGVELNLTTGRPYDYNIG